MDPASLDPADSLSQKLTAFADALPDEELELFHDIIHLAGTSPTAEVEGFAFRPTGTSSADPCEGGEIFNQAGTLQVLGNLHQSLHPRRPAPGSGLGKLV
jgi:hypothetical protein